MIFFVTELLCLLTLERVFAQSPPLPPKLTANLTRQSTYDNHVSLAHAVLDIAVNMAISDKNGTLKVHDISLTTAILYSQMAEFDKLTQNTFYRDLVQVQLPQASVEAVASPLTTIEDYSVYGYAASKFYLAYQDTSFLNMAEEFWNLGRAYYISEKDITSKKIATKTSTLRGECNGKSLIGGVFQACPTQFSKLYCKPTCQVMKNTNSSFGVLESRATATFFTLSALLAEMTSNSTYTDAAKQSLQYLRNFAYFPRSNGPENEKLIYALDGDPSCLDNGYQHSFPVTGDIIEGLSILTSIQNDTATYNLLQDAITSSTLYRQDQQSDGVLHVSGLPETFPPSDPYLVRGLTTAYKRNHISSTMHDYVKEFINIQYNFLLDNATLQESNIVVDIDKPLLRGLGYNQTFAAMIFVQAISTANSTSSATTTSSLPGPTASETRKGATTGKIVGGVIGGVASVALLVGLAIFICKKRNQRRGSSQYLTSPFELPELRERNDLSTTSQPVEPHFYTDARNSMQIDDNSIVSPTSFTSTILSEEPAKYGFGALYSR
ncbi:hypothetical protein L218DRAFT_1005342 [Marasmius fiardii PR-910]|nr:hypothetical protein L218DRAFT_1005342 [Marasmius fiardii PR-910]